MANRSLVSPTANPLLEKALADKLMRRSEVGGSLGELEPLAIRLGLMQNTLKPRLKAPQLLVFAADHGIAVDGIQPPPGQGGRVTVDTVRMLLAQQLPVTAFARSQHIDLTVVDCGMAENLPPNDRLMMRKIAHGTRNARTGVAMTLEQAHAGMRAGMEIGDKLRGNVTLLAGVGVGSHESAALVLSRLSDRPVRDFIVSGPHMEPELQGHLLGLLSAVQTRHRHVAEPIEVLAAFGGFELAVMAGVMLMAASKRHLLVVDGVPACAALLVASRIAQPVTDYCLFCRSHNHHGLDQALNVFQSAALLELGMDSTDGTGATLVWPLVKSAGALLSEVANLGDDTPVAADAASEAIEPFAPPTLEPSPFGDALY
ncbi:Nicotinate-nucleotide--dimethylbenzimidazole phosphoribosyltransferase [Rubrivivax sp. A210]|uniref:nicotinate-nucleotide--dimethylbenzimidazole phosphoribosyltransferase n=1 Tax=Rubrivivax sp. A210 TaxID=2772301 RepID=UPI0019196281|nr:nicotinate-nucleotide--dimethylbenzimidazole phosphoribosyltransferase [Rubrivivax sp. A210]CAD5372574.1 Nicotinate-nucleotide--dimethylbenzimidazole phosphoribosyltransferase [Rubrivivax sp. A210]